MPGKVLRVAVLVFPVVSTFSPKALVILLIAAGVLPLLDPATRRGVLAGLPRLLLVLLIGLALWSLVTVSWAPTPAGSLKLWIRVVGLSLVGLLLVGMARKLTPEERDNIERSLVVSGVVFVVLFAIEIVSLGWISGKLIAVWNLLTPWQSAKPAVQDVPGPASASLAIFAWPCAVAIHRRHSWRWMAAFLAAVAVVLLGQSMLSSFIAFATGLVVLAVSGKAPRAVTVAIVCTVVAVNAALFLSAPEVVARYRQDTVTIDIPTSWQHRFYILDFARGEIAEHPVVGRGFDAARSIGQDVVGPFAGYKAIPLHLHNAWAQIWLELGLLGLLICCALVICVLWSLARHGSRRVEVSAGLACTCCYLVIGNISFGIWQNWWLAVAWLGAGLITSLAASADRREPAKA